MYLGKQAVEKGLRDKRPSSRIVLIYIPSGAAVDKFID
jgi:hypothetical protein